MTLRDALLEASTHIARRDAETLLAHTLHHDRAWLLAHTEDDLSANDLETFRALAARRAKQEPLQHITGTQEFFGLNLRVTPDVLIPRPETEHLVEAVLNWAHAQSDIQPESARGTDIPAAASSRPLQIADVGTGSGAIAIALASALSRAFVTAIDISPAALAVARANAQQHHLTHRIRFLEGDLLNPWTSASAAASSRPEPLSKPQASRIGRSGETPVFRAPEPGAPGLDSETWVQKTDAAVFDIIVSNPPYVALSEASTLAPEVRDHEPSLALYAGPDGLEIYRRLIPQAFDLLRPGGLLALEIGFGQRHPLTDLLSAWNNVRLLDDYASIPRVVLALRP